MVRKFKVEKKKRELGKIVRKFGGKIKKEEKEIPHQLQNINFRFLRLQKKEKKPIAEETKWQKNNFKFGDKKLVEHLKRGGNYGIIGGYGNLILIDADTKEIADICEKMPETFTIKTGSPEEWKKHYYFITDKKMKGIRLTKDKVGDLGDVRSIGQYVVAPNSIHPKGDVYKIIKDYPIGRVGVEQIKEYFKEYLGVGGSENFGEFPTITTKRSDDFIRNCRMPDYVINNKLKSNSSKNWELFPYLVDILHNREVTQDVYVKLCKTQGHNVGAIKGWVKKAHEGKLMRCNCKKMQEYIDKFHPDLKKEICGRCELFLKEAREEQKERIKIPSDDRLISDFADEVAQKFKDKNIIFYRSDLREIVEIGKLKLPNGKELENGFIPLSPNRFITILEQYYAPFITKYGRYGGFDVKKSINSAIANVVLVSQNMQNVVPVINRIFSVQQPVIYEGKLTFPKESYDERFGSWLPSNAPKIINPEMELKEAKKILKKIFSEFCFKEEQSRTNAVAGLLTPYLRGLYSAFNIRSPIFAYLGNRERTGKDYCAGITGILFEGEAIEEPPISTNDKTGNSNEELRKKLLSAMIRGRKRFHSSNNKGLLNNAVFENITTAKKYDDRLLGKNEVVCMDNEIDYSFSGNIGMSLTPDLMNRSVFINLFYDEEDVNKRKFKNPHLHEWVKENRGEILSALYCLIKNWFDNGCPKGSVEFASFHEWADICGGIMECAGFQNPCKKAEKSFGLSLDSETEDMKVLFESCYESFPDEWVMKKSMKELAKNEGIFNYFDWDKHGDITKFGKKVEKFVGRVLSDIRLMVQDESVRSSRRCYKFVKNGVKIESFDGEKNDLRVKLGRVGNVGRVLTLPKHKKTKLLSMVKKPTKPTNPTKPTTNITFQVLKDVKNIAIGEDKSINLEKGKVYNANILGKNPKTILNILSNNKKIKLINQQIKNQQKTL